MNACTSYDIIPYSFFCNMIVEDDLEASLDVHTVSSSSSYYEYIRDRWRAARKMQKKKECEERKKNQRKMFTKARRHKEEANEAAPMIKRKKEKEKRSSWSRASLRGSPRGSLVITGSCVTTKQLDDDVIPTYTTTQVEEEGSLSLIVRASESSFNATQLDDSTIEDQNDETALNVHKHSYFIGSSGCEVVHNRGS